MCFSDGCPTENVSGFLVILQRNTYLILSLLDLVLLGLRTPLRGELLPQLFQSFLLLFLRQRREFFGRFGEVGVLGLGGVELCLRLAPEFLATLVADQAAGFFTRFGSRWFLIFSWLRRLDLFQGLVLILLQPFKRPLHCTCRQRERSGGITWDIVTYSHRSF